MAEHSTPVESQSEEPLTVPLSQPPPQSLSDIDSLNCTIPIDPSREEPNSGISPQPQAPIPSSSTPLIHHASHLSIGDLCIPLEAVTKSNEQPTHLMVAGRIISLRHYSKHIVRRVLDRAWPCRAPWAIEEVDKMEHNTFLFMFHSRED